MSLLNGNIRLYYSYCIDHDQNPTIENMVQSFGKYNSYFMIHMFKCKKIYFFVSIYFYGILVDLGNNKIEQKMELNK